MTREDYEQSERAWLEGLLPRGPGDPDAYGYPGEPESKEVKDDEPEDVPF